MKVLIVFVGVEVVLGWIVYVFVNMMYVYEVIKYEVIVRIIERIWVFFIGGIVFYVCRFFLLFIIIFFIGYVLREFLRIK